MAKIEFLTTFPERKYAMELYYTLDVLGSAPRSTFVQ
jgi:hypothetical protein